MTSPRSLVVGSTGQVGAALARILGTRAIATGRAPANDCTPAIDLADLAHDARRAFQLLTPLTLDAVYCVGGATDVERCESDIKWAMDVNCFGPAALAAACRDLPFVYFSTEYVFDGRDAPGHPGGPYSEADATGPISVYGRSKLAGEQRILDVHPAALIVRTTVVYGPDNQRKNFLYTLTKHLRANQQMRVPADQISSPTFNADLAAATIELVSIGACGIFNVCGPERLSRYDFALLAAEILGFDAALIQPVKTVELRQKALRPLAAGLMTDKLRASLRNTKMRANRDAITAWAASDAHASKTNA